LSLKYNLQIDELYCWPLRQMENAPALAACRDLSVCTLEKGLELRAMVRVSKGVVKVDASGEVAPVEVVVGRQILRLADRPAQEQHLVLVYFTTTSGHAMENLQQLLLQQVSRHPGAQLLRVHMDECPHIAAPCGIPPWDARHVYLPCIQAFSHTVRASFLQGFDHDLVASATEHFIQTPSSDTEKLEI
jgi:hypothetical protein